MMNRHMSEREKIKDVVYKTLAEVTDLDSETFTGQTELTRDLNMDSLLLYEWVIELETHYNMQISDEDIDRIKTLDDVIWYIEHEGKTEG
jgi:acyl carrier protein